MKKILAGLFLLCSALPAAAQAPAMPDSVLFYPDMAEVTVVEKLAPSMAGNRRGLLLHLPAGATQNGFSATVAGEPVGMGLWFVGDDPDAEGERTAQFSDEETNPERKTLLQGIEDLQKERTRLESEQSAATARFELWTNRKPPEKGDDPDSLSKLDGLLTERLATLEASVAEYERQGAAQDRKIQRAQEALRKFDQSRVKDLKALLPADGVSGQVEVRYTYTVPARTASNYRILAEPKDKRVTIVQEVTLEQYSGQSWKDVQVLVSTLRKNQSLAPYPPALWPVEFRRPVEMDHSKYSEATPMAMEAPAPEPRMRAAMKAQINAGAYDESSDEVMRPAPVPVAEDRSTFRLWDLGRRNLEDKRPTEIRVLKDTHEARFFYTLRPAVDRLSFLTAEVTAKEPQELPPGQARFYVDGVLVGQAPFAFNGEKGRLFLGQDPRVTAGMRDLQREAGTQGFISKENTEVWHWEITVKNARTFPVSVQVEDPAPNPSDTAISVKFESLPKPAETHTDPAQGERKIYRWSLELKPGESTVIDHKVTVTAPSDKPLEPGRGAR